MIDDCNINNLAKNQVSAVFNSRAIRRSVSSKFIEICMGRHVGAHPYGHQPGGRKPTETSVTEFCCKSVNLSFEELKNITIIFLNTRTRSDSQISRNKSRNKSLFNQLGSHVNAASRKSLLGNSSIAYRKTKNPFGTKLRLNISFQLLVYLIKVKYQQDQ